MIFLYYFTWIICLYSIDAETFTNIGGELSTHIFDPHGADFGMDSLRPLAESTETLNVTLDWNLVSINDLDETNGYVAVSGFVTIQWTTAYATTLDTVEMIKPKLLWKPPIVLLNSVETWELIGHDTSVKVRYDFKTKECQWKPWVVIRASCSPDVQYYPFDKQSCSFRLSVWGYKHSEVFLDSKSKQWEFQHFEENGEWKIDGTSVETSTINDLSVIDFKMKLTRRPLYYVINLIAPVLLLSVLNSFAFLLPIESGERVGFTVTCFLSFIVLLNLIMDFLPTSALPLSYLSYYTFVMMIFSAAVSVASLCTIKLYHKPKGAPVPSIVAMLFTCLTCRKSLNQKNEALKSVQAASAEWDIESFEEDTVSQSTIIAADDSLTWRQIARSLDTLLFLGSLGGQIFYSTAYLVPLFLNQ